MMDACRIDGPKINQVFNFFFFLNCTFCTFPLDSLALDLFIYPACFRIFSQLGFLSDLDQGMTIGINKSYMSGGQNAILIPIHRNRPYLDSHTTN